MREITTDRFVILVNIKTISNNFVQYCIMNRKVHNSQELNIQLPLVVPDHKHKGKLLFSDQTLIIKDCIKSILSTITFHRALGEIYPLGTDCEVLDQISYVSCCERQLDYFSS